jgi:hypothetical protein
MDPQQEIDLDALIASVEDEGEASPASTAKADEETREIAEPDGSSQDEAGDVNEGESEGEDGAEPGEGDEPYEVNVADLTPVQGEQAQGDFGALLQEVSGLRGQLAQMQGYQSQVQEDNERREFAAFLESLKGMDPDEAKDAVSTRIATSYIALQKQVKERAEQDQRTAAQQFEDQQREKVIKLISMGGRRQETPQGLKFVADPKLVLTDDETELVREAAVNGLDASGVENLATRLVARRGTTNAQKRKAKQQQDSQNGASRTLAGAGAAKPPAKEYKVGDLETMIDDLFPE